MPMLCTDETPQGRALDDELGVQHYLDRFGEALAANDAKAIAAMWAVPAFVLGAGKARPVTTRDEVGQFFSGAHEHDNRRGVRYTRADIIRLDPLTDDLVIVRVRWPYLDAQGQERGGETSTYTLERIEDVWMMRVVVMHGAERMH